MAEEVDKVAEAWKAHKAEVVAHMEQMVVEDLKQGSPWGAPLGKKGAIS